MVCPQWRCLTLSLNVLGPASNGVAVLIDMRQCAAWLLRCLGWGGRHGSARPSSSMETAECACWRFLSWPPHALAHRDPCLTTFLLGSVPSRFCAQRTRLRARSRTAVRCACARPPPPADRAAAARTAARITAARPNSMCVAPNRRPGQLSAPLRACRRHATMRRAAATTRCLLSSRTYVSSPSPAPPPRPRPSRLLRRTGAKQSERARESERARWLPPDCLPPCTTQTHPRAHMRDPPLLPPACTNLHPHVLPPCTCSPSPTPPPPTTTTAAAAAAARRQMVGLL